MGKVAYKSYLSDIKIIEGYKIDRCMKMKLLLLVLLFTVTFSSHSIAYGPAKNKQVKHALVSVTPFRGPHIFHQGRHKWHHMHRHQVRQRLHRHHIRRMHHRADRR